MFSELTKRDIYILFGIIDTVLLGIIIWQLIVTGYYVKISFYLGSCIIGGYHSLLYFLISKTRRLAHHRIILIFRWFICIMAIAGVIFLIDFSKLFNVPPLLYFLEYYLFIFGVGMIFISLGLLKVL
jgi:hypothetical protein